MNKMTEEERAHREQMLRHAQKHKRKPERKIYAILTEQELRAALAKNFIKGKK